MVCMLCADCPWHWLSMTLLSPNDGLISRVGKTNPPRIDRTRRKFGLINARG